MRILSGIQPTGEMHIGNYLGAVQQWVHLQDQHECFFPVVDLHALTVPQNPKTFRRATLNKVTELIAAGLDPGNCVLFVQSHIPQHTELAWLLNTLTPLGELERMTQYKDKAKKQKQVLAGLFNYPVLMASDILLYQTDAVPVGKDQVQHLELTRMLARKFNAQFGKTFKEPEALLVKEGAKIQSLTDPKKKMSKSDPADSYISLFEEPEAIRRKIKKAVTDTGKKILYNPQKKPGISNLLLIYALFSGMTPKEAEKQFKNTSYAILKREVADLLVEKLEPFRRKKKELSSRDLYVQELLSRGAKKAESVAADTLEHARKRMGLLEP